MVGVIGTAGGAVRGFAEWLQVAADGLIAAPVPQRLDFVGQGGRVGVPGVESFVQVGLERVEQAAA